MRWQRKARIQQACAAIPGGARLYRQIQRRFGRLDSDPFRRLPRHAAMLRRLAGLGFDPAGVRCLEVGTGHLPVAPVGFYLAGAREVVTVDLHRRLQPRLTSEMLRRLVAAGDRVVSLYAGLADAAAVRERLALIDAMADRPYSLLDRIGVRYVAPGNAARMPDGDASFDLSFSMTVLEHVSPRALREILDEAHRLLRPDGFAAHLIDPSDHFAHQDPGITRINFLRFSAPEWFRVAGNEFSYCNRLRSPQFERAFTAAGFRIDRCDRTVDEPSRTALDQGFPVHEDFRAFDAAELCTTELEIYARPRLPVRSARA
jgi:SAM-dependent methyltransferase